MKTLSILALTTLVAAGGFAAPSFAAPSASDNVPFCSGGLTDTQLQDGAYGSLLARKGESLDRLVLWNNCIEATYHNASGQISTAFYDPDTLKLVDSMDASGNIG